MQIQDALAQFLLQLRADGRSPHTIGQYRRHGRAFADWMAAAKAGPAIAVVTPELLAQFFGDDRSRKRGDGAAKKAVSVNAMRTSIRCFFGWARDAGHVAQNPARLLRRARCSSPPPRALHDDEVAALRAALVSAGGAEAERDRMLVELLLGTGLRIGSAIALDVSDVDLVHGEVHVRAAKNDRPAMVLLPTATAAALKPFLAGRTGAVFVGKGKRITVRHAQRRFGEWVQAAGIGRKASLHSLRHTFGTRVYRQTRDLLLTQRALGHASIVSTTVYSTVSDDGLRAVVGARSRP